MRSLVFVSIALFATASCTVERVGTVDQHDYGDFSWIVTRILGAATGYSLTNYGCHCGRGNADYTIWVDEVDNCCRIHDEAYLAAPNVAQGCSCATQAYQYTIANGVVTCGANQGACATHCCAADKAFVECVGPIASTMQRKYELIDRANVCTPRECVVDEDCEPGLWCGGGTCRMYCDPSYPGVDGVCETEPVVAHE